MSRFNLFTIEAGLPFLTTLAIGLLRLAGDDPLGLPRITVLLPTRRAVRALREAFLRVAPDGKEPGAPLLLPRMQPIGDLEADELEIATVDRGDLAVPPPIPALRRRLLLTRLVMRWGRWRGHDPILPGQAAALAANLSRLLDKVATEGVSFDRIGALVPDDLAEHWQMVSKFLEILPQHWPGMLAAEAAIDPADRRNRLLALQAAAWRRAPPRHPVVAAGLNGGVPALTELLSVVARLDHGAVVLAGLDRAWDPAEWAAIEADEGHPQHLLARLLRELGTAPADVRDWPAAAPPEVATQARLRLIGEAMRPAATTDAWRRLPPADPRAFERVARYDCGSAQQEALTVALLLRRQLERPGATAALVTPDRALARRVAAELRRWGIEIDDSAGVPISRTPPGAFLRLVLELVISGLAPVPLLAALKHPLAAGGLAPPAFRTLTRALERAISGPRPAPGIAGIEAAVAGAGPRLRRFAGRLEACLGDFPDLVAGEAVPLAAVVAAHVAAAERLAASDQESGADRLWREPAGETAAQFCHELIDAARDFPPLPGRHYPALFDALAGGVAVRPAFGRHPRLAIWGLVEARLQQADLVVLGGVNEGSWPGAPAHDPWMSRQMQRDFGIAVPERAIGIAAHDFVQACAAPQVALTRAARQEGVPSLPSRWLLRLDAVLRAAGLDGALRPDPQVASAAIRIDEPAEYRPLPPAEPRPPLAARPRRLSVTQVETWLRDPYAIYARHILGLKPLDEIDADPGRAELGICIHRALDEFVRRFPRELPEDPAAELLRIGRAKFGPLLSRPGAWAFWWPRFERIARWLAVIEQPRRSAIAESISECKGSLVLPAPGGSFELTATADRIDRLADGQFLLIDYKTGSLPRKKEIRAGFAPQLPLEAAILRDGSFGEIRGSVTALEYWRLGGGDPPGQVWEIGEGDPMALVDLVFSRVTALVERFDDPATPYLAMPMPEWRPRYSDYRHLERVAEAETEE